MSRKQEIPSSPSRSRQSARVFSLASAMALSVVGSCLPALAGSTGEAMLLSWQGAFGSGSSALDALSGKGPWRIPASSRSVKATFVFEAAFKASRLEIESCAEPFAEGFDVYLNYDGAKFFAEGGTRVLSYALDGVQKIAESVRSISITSDGNAGACVSSIRFFDGDRRIAVELLRAEPARVDKSYLALFDARLETAVPIKGPIEVTFEKPLKVVALEVWNGDQSSMAAHRANARVRSIALEGERGYKERFEVSEAMSPQRLELKIPYEGRFLRLRAHVASGEKAIPWATEIRLATESRSVQPDVSRVGSEVEADLRARFARASLAQVLDRGLAAVVDGETWILRLRADGTFYARGFDDNVRLSRAYVASGRFDVTSAKASGVDLRLTGWRRSSRTELDSDSCATYCADRSIGRAGIASFAESLRLESVSGSGHVRVRSLAEPPLLFRHVGIRFGFEESMR